MGFAVVGLLHLVRRADIADKTDKCAICGFKCSDNSALTEIGAYPAQFDQAGVEMACACRLTLFRGEVGQVGNLLAQLRFGGAHSLDIVAHVGSVMALADHNAAYQVQIAAGCKPNPQVPILTEVRGYIVPANVLKQTGA